MLNFINLAWAGFTGLPVIKQIGKVLLWVALGAAAVYLVLNRRAPANGPQSPKKQAEELQETHQLSVDERKSSVAEAEKEAEAAESLHGDALAAELNRARRERKQ